MLHCVCIIIDLVLVEDPSEHVVCRAASCSFCLCGQRFSEQDFLLMALLLVTNRCSFSGASSPSSPTSVVDMTHHQDHPKDAKKKKQAPPGRRCVYVYMYLFDLCLSLVLILTNPYILISTYKYKYTPIHSIPNILTTWALKVTEARLGHIRTY